MQQIKEARNTVEAWVYRDTDGTLTLSLKKPVKDADFGWSVPGQGSTEQNHVMLLKEESLPELKPDTAQKVVITLV